MSAAGDSTEVTSFNIFPTLVHQNVFVWNDDNTSTAASLKVFNLLGELENEFSVSESNLPTVFNLSSLPAGIYLLQLSKNSHSFIRKIMKD
jgi:hypothetical protein